jgi:nucleoside-diphosphate-sugar epimerase
MKVLVIGASGYVGSGIVKALQARDHEVWGTARSPEAHKLLQERGVAAIQGDVRDPRALADAARQAGAAIYSVQLTSDDSFEIDRAALEAIVAAFAGSGKPLIYTSGVWYYGATGQTAATEETPANPIALVAKRPALERIVLDAAAHGVRGIVIRPALVYGHFAGIPMMLAGSAKESGAARFVGDGANHWPLVHVDDLGELYALALERAKPGDVFNATDDSYFTVAEVAQAASRFAGAGGRTQAWPLEEARKVLGPFADALAIDQKISSGRARTQLGWQARPATIVENFGP